jgi:hypothetical protein
MAIGDQTRQQADEKVDGVAVARVFDLGDVLELEHRHAVTYIAGRQLKGRQFASAATVARTPDRNHRHGRTVPVNSSLGYRSGGFGDPESSPLFLKGILIHLSRTQVKVMLVRADGEIE